MNIVDRVIASEGKACISTPEEALECLGALREAIRGTARALAEVGLFAALSPEDPLWLEVVHPVDLPLAA